MNARIALAVLIGGCAGPAGTIRHDAIPPQPARCELSVTRDVALDDAALAAIGAMIDEPTSGADDAEIELTIEADRVDGCGAFPPILLARVRSGIPSDGVLFAFVIAEEPRGLRLLGRARSSWSGNNACFTNEEAAEVSAVRWIDAIPGGSAELELSVDIIEQLGCPTGRDACTALCSADGGSLRCAGILVARSTVDHDEGEGPPIETQLDVEVDLGTDGTARLIDPETRRQRGETIDLRALLDDADGDLCTEE